MDEKTKNALDALNRRLTDVEDWREAMGEWRSETMLLLQILDRKLREDGIIIKCRTGRIGG